MIYVQIKGGLGNQLFQYAAAYYLKTRLGGGGGVCLDYSSADIGKLLNCMKVKKSFAFRDILLECFALEQHTTRSSIITFLADVLIQRTIKNKGFNGNRIIPAIREDGRNCRDNNLDILNNAGRYKDVIITGYWQNIHYIEPIKDALIQQFRIKLRTGTEYESYLKRIQSCNSIGIHVRRGDFVTLGWDKGAEYYINAMMAARKSVPDAKFFFFSDDHEWVKKNLYNENDCTLVSIHEDFPDVKEFDLLRHCQNQVISESTFGWWCGYLNENRRKQVFIPFDCKGDIWLEDWKRVEYTRI